MTPPPSAYGTVLRVEQVSPHLVRVVLGGPGLAGFAQPQWADSYVNAQFLPDASPVRVPFEADRARELPDGQRPVPRRYTVRSWDPVSGELALDFVVHGDGNGDGGIAGRWAERARPGDRLQLRGPAGAYSPDPAADAHLLVGDGSALPAMAVALERVPAGVPVQAVVQVPEAADELPLDSPGALSLTWVHGDGAATGLLAAVVAGLDRPAGRTHAFVHGEADAIRAVRRVLVREWGISPADLSCSAYWRHGHTDEQWRQVKGAWTRAMEQDA